MKTEHIKQAVRKNYAEVARQDSSSCCTPKSGTPSCCCGSNTSIADNISRGIGYSEEDLKSVPQGSNLGLGCGNPIALASLKEGETVLDLGSGAGFDCFLAAQRVGKTGHVIGVDMTPEMLDRARENARRDNIPNVEFRLGEIENLPVADNAVDVIISNCVINLAPDKKRVFQEAYRVLKPGGRMMISDIVLLKPLPDVILNSVSAYVGCIAGAQMKADYLADIKAAGFNKVTVVDESFFPADCIASDPTAQAIVNGISNDAVQQAIRSVSSIKVSAVKP
jgi:SAM-dependent methyltransferase